MSNFTLEDYKEAIRAKYEKDINNPLSDSLTSLSQAYLRDFCWQKFEGGLSEDDLKIFASFFGFEFNALKRSLFKDSTDRFRPIGTFLSRKTDLASIEAVNLTAVLVDFQYRPFRKFREKGVINYLKHPEDSKIPEPFVVKYEDEIKEEDGIKEEDEVKEEVNTATKTFVDNLVAEMQVNGFANLEPDINKEEENQVLEEIEVLTIVSQSPSKNPSRIVIETIVKFKNAAIATSLIFSLISTVIYFAFFKNDCMQWSGDHYEVVDCSSKNDVNVVIPKKDELLDFRKLKVCDTTTCFKKDGEAFVWYTKTPDGGIEFFNGYGRHPEYKRPLRPVSHYIFNKYVKGKPCK